MTDEEAELEDRLENWGRWARGTPNVGRSSLLRVIESNPENVILDEETPIDSLDALEVNRAWMLLPTSPMRYLKAKMLIGRLYAYPHVDPVHDLRKFCQISIHRREIDELLSLAKKMMANNLRRFKLKKETDAKVSKGELDRLTTGGQHE